MKKMRIRPTSIARTLAVGLFFGFIWFAFFLVDAGTKTIDPASETPSDLKTNGTTPPAAGRKYSEFPHGKHKQACSACHKFPSANWKKVRASADAFPDITDYPKHTSCLNCHRKQFYSGPSPVICSICHTNPGPRNSARHPFPNPREIFDKSPKGRRAVSDFAISFPHETHIAMLGENRNPEKGDGSVRFVNARMNRKSEESCSVCHQTYQPQGDGDEEFVTPPPEDLGDRFWLKKGTFKTSPIGHTQCFTCHSTETGILPAPQDCAVCHKPKPKESATDFDPKVAAAMNLTDKILLTSWRRRDSSATFRHEWFSHNELDCASCHQVNQINTLDAATKKVDVMSCSICHITATSDDGGILNYEIDERKTNPKFQCVKCHLSYGSAAIPASHLKAIADQQ